MVIEDVMQGRTNEQLKADAIALMNVLKDTYGPRRAPLDRRTDLDAKITELNASMGRNRAARKLQAAVRGRKKSLVSRPKTRGAPPAIRHQRSPNSLSKSFVYDHPVVTGAPNSGQVVLPHTLLLFNQNNLEYPNIKGNNREYKQLYWQTRPRGNPRSLLKTRPRPTFRNRFKYAFTSQPRKRS